MNINELKDGYIVRSGLCTGYSVDGSLCKLPILVATVKKCINEDKIELVQIIHSPEVYVESKYIYGIELNLSILHILGFIKKNKKLAICPAPDLMNGALYEAEIDNQKVQVLCDGDEFHLCMSKTREPVKVLFVHDIQEYKKTNGKPLKIDYMRFYPKQ